MTTNRRALPGCNAHEELRAREGELRRRAKEPRPFREAAQFAAAAVLMQKLRFAHLDACRLCQMTGATRAA
jgi:hypothetical protein